ncbi:MAG: hypothetical protein P8J32_08150 [bacterium]|jgi:hypothetical protein|nr:hypothetical protein [bacterium]
MTSKILTGTIFFLVMGALMYQRFDAPAQLIVTVASIEGESIYTAQDEVPRGSFLTTENEFLSVTIGPDRVLKLAPRTTIELKSLSPDNVVLDMTRGRIVFVSETSESPTTIETNHTTHQLNEGSLTMVNFDFLETVHIIPFSGALYSQLLLVDEHLDIADPISIQETEPVRWEYIVSDLTEGDAADFYRWTGVLTQ